VPTTEPPSPSNQIAHPLSTPLKNIVDLSDYRIEYVPATATAHTSSVNIVIRSAPLPANYRKLHHTSEQANIIFLILLIAMCPSGVNVVCIFILIFQSSTLTHSILLDVRSVEKQLKNCSKSVLSRSPTLEQLFVFIWCLPIHPFRFIFHFNFFFFQFCSAHRRSRMR
jgi:hypothetical protein